MMLLRQRFVPLVVSTAQAAAARRKGGRGWSVSFLSTVVSPSSTIFSGSGIDVNDKNFQETLQYYGRKKQTPVNLQTLLETGSGAKLNEFIQFNGSNNKSQSDRIISQIACFLHRELPVRIAHRIVELEDHEYFRASPSIQNVCNWYKMSFAQLRSVAAPGDAVKEEEFAKVIESIYERHSSTLIVMARGAVEIKHMLNVDTNDFAETTDIQRRLDDFYLSRIGIRMLIGQYLELRSSFKGLKPTKENMIGMVSLKCSVKNIAEEAVRDASYMCSRLHGDAPEVTFHGRTDLHFPYVPSHLSYMLLELLKNSMRATVETHGVDKMPPIRIVIADGEDNEDVVIKISDEGGGIRRSNMKRIWSYLFTTANPAILTNLLSNDLRDFDTASPLAGLGYGLPISRNYARYFNGDLTIMSMEGYGTDGFIYLPRITTQTGAIIKNNI